MDAVDASRVPFPSQLEPFLALGPSDVPVPASDRDWLAFSLIEDTLLREGMASPAQVELASGCLDSLGAVGTSLLRLLLLEVAYSQALSAGQANDLLQRLMDPLIETLARELSLLDFVAVSTSVENEIRRNPGVRRRVEREAVYRLLAALTIGGSYPYAERLVEKATREAESRTTTLASYKTALQETLAQAKRDPPSYSVLRQDGPPHDLTFIVAVTTPDHRSAEGVGPSKKKAEEQAARAYLSMYWRRHLDALERMSSSSGEGRRWPDSRLRHDREALASVAHEFQIPEAALPLLSLALTHKASTGSPLQSKHWQSLAQLGALALDVIARRMVVEEGIKAGGWTTSPTVSANLARDTLASVEAFQELRLDRLFIVDERARTSRVRSDAFQAVVAVALLTHGEAAPELLPRRIAERFRALVRRGVSSSALEVHDSKTLLQELVAPIRVTAAYEVARAVGPPHSRTFHSRLTLTSSITGREIAVSGGSGSSRVEADKKLATQVGHVLLIANGAKAESEVSVPGKQSSKELASFFLEAEIAALRTDALALRRLAGIDALGARLLRTGDREGFELWAEETASLLGESLDAADDALLAYYRHVGSLAGLGTAAAYADDIAGVVEP